MRRTYLSVFAFLVVGLFAFTTVAEEWERPSKPRPGPGRPRPRPGPGKPRPRPRPQPSTVYIGNVSANNPMSWDTDTVRNNNFGYWYGVAFELDRGVRTEIGEVQATCQGGYNCFYDRFNYSVDQGRPVWVEFPHGLDVESITVRIRPDGISIPPSKINVFLYR